MVAALELSKTSKDRINTSSAFTSFKNNYLVVYSLMMGTFRSQSFLHFPSELLLFMLESHSLCARVVCFTMLDRIIPIFVTVCGSDQRCLSPRI